MLFQNLAVQILNECCSREREREREREISFLYIIKLKNCPVFL